VGLDPAPLATEALRGEGATLINEAGERFMLALHPDGELAPRDIVARGVFDEGKRSQVYLDTRFSVGAHIKTEFAQVYASCIKAGIDPIKNPIPIAPAAHYHMGGVLVDANGRSTVDGLWACGEAASTGAHGANRLASNSLLEAVVYATRVASDISKLLPEPKPVGWPEVAAATERLSAPANDATISELRTLMSAHMGVVRDGAGLATALLRIEELLVKTKSQRNRNMLEAALIMTACAYLRLESRGGHYRSDYPEADPASTRSKITLPEAYALVRHLKTKAA
jgi:L-aspartate oxidase